MTGDWLDLRKAARRRPAIPRIEAYRGVILTAVEKQVDIRLRSDPPLKKLTERADQHAAVAHRL